MAMRASKQLPLSTLVSLAETALLSTAVSR